MEAIAEAADEVETEGVIIETITEAATEDRRIGRKLSWMKEYHM